jgi:hypothetical protein
MQHIVIAPPGASAVEQAFVVPHTREAIELAVDAFLARLDEMDGDPDLEPNGDELDGDPAAEDEFTHHSAFADRYAPGCPISDPDMGLDEGEPNFVRVKGEGPGCAISDPDVAADDEGEAADEDGDETYKLSPPRYGIDQTEILPSAPPAAPRTAPAAPARRGRDDHLTPDECPEVYCSVATGNCLDPIHKDGARLVMSKSAPVREGDIVAVWLRPGLMRPDQPQKLVKRLVQGLPAGMGFPYAGSGETACQPLVIVEMLNPPQRFSFPAAQILAIHRVIGEAAVAPDGRAFVPRSLIEEARA